MTAPNYPGIPDRFDVTCPICKTTVTVPVTGIGVERIIDMEDYSTMNGQVIATVERTRGIDLTIRGSVWHNCKVPPPGEVETYCPNKACVLEKGHGGQCDERAAL